MAKMLLVNPMAPPSKRRRKLKTATRRKHPMAAKKRRTAAQRAATRRLVAANKRRRRNPIPKAATRRRRRNPLGLSRVGSRVARRASRRASTRRPTVRRYRNPVSSTRIMDLLKQASMAASGALALDIAWGYLPIPDNMKVGGLKHVVKGAGAIVMGMLADKVVSKRTAESMTIGALTVIVHDAAREVLSTMAPGVKMDGLGYYSPGMVMGEYMQPALAAPGAGMGMYMNTTADQRWDAEMAGYYG